MGDGSACSLCGEPLDGSGDEGVERLCTDCLRTRTVGSAHGREESQPPQPEPDPRRTRGVFRLPPPGTVIEGLEVEGALGSGGMGSLVTAVDPRLERRVAIKFLREGLRRSSRAIKRFDAEGRALAQIAHPHVVHVYSTGTWEDWPYLVMELVAGAPLRERIEPRGMPIDECLRIAEQIASALAAIHDHDIAHRDINPSNVLLRGADDSVCVIDFGLARELERDTRTTQGVLGTPGYMAPEQWMGQRHDVRVDVYAFGMTLWEMLVGDLPFPTGNAHFQHVAIAHRDVPLVRNFRADVPRPVEVLVARALSPAQEFRHPNGRALLDHVRKVRLGETGSPPLQVSDISSGFAPPLDASEELPFIGRADEYRAVVHAVEEAALGRGSVLLVEGSPGTGKSRFLREAERAAGARALQILRCRGAEYGGAPLAALRALLLTHAAEPRVGGTEGVLRRVRIAAPGNEYFLPILRWFLAPDSAAVQMQPGREGLRQALLALMRSIFAEMPTALLVEHAHLLDEVTADLIVEVASLCAAWPVTVLASYRPQAEPGRASTFLAALPRLTSFDTVSVLPLGPLSEGAVASMLHHGLGITDDEACRLAPRVQKRAGGNALYVVECVRALRSDRSRGKTDMAERLSRLTLPPRLLELARRRIDALLEDERDALGAVSVDADGVTSAFVARSLDCSQLGALRILQRLCRERGLLVEEDGGYRIPHAEVREAAYGELLPELRRGYHLQAARALQDDVGDGRLPDPGRVGYHLLHAGRPDEAVPHLVQAARDSHSRCLFVAAVELYDLALSVAATEVADPIRIARASVLADLGRHSEALAVYEDLVRRGRLVPDALLGVAEILKDNLQYDEALEALSRIELAEDDVGRRYDKALLELSILSRTSRHDEARAALEKLREIGDQGKPIARARALVAEGNLLWRSGDSPGALACWRQAFDVFDAHGAVDSALVTMCNIGMRAVEAADIDTGAALLEPAIERARIHGARRPLDHATISLIEVYSERLDLERADALVEQAELQLAEHGDEVARTLLLGRRCEIEIARGDGARTVHFARQALTPSDGVPRYEGGFLVYLARGQLLQDLHMEAVETARQAAAVYREDGDLESIEEATALAARGLRLAGMAGPEREAMRALTEPRTMDGAIEAVCEARAAGQPDEEPLRRARSLAVTPYRRRELESWVGA